MKSILRSLAVLAVLAGFTGSAFAQDNDNDIIRPITKQGSAAFMFTINGLGEFGIGAPSLNPGLMPAGFGFKYFLADDVALRVLLGLGTESVGDDSISGTSFGLGVGAEYHFRPLYSTSPYIGAQIGFQSSSMEHISGPDGATTTFTDNESAFSIAFLAGFDWFFTRGIAIGAEYSLGFISRSGEEETQVTGGTTITDEDPSRSNIGFNSVGNVHLNVYF